MANTEFSYVKSFELPDSLPPSNFIVVRIDGRGFSKLCKKYHFAKPNDRRAIDLMNSAAVEVVRSFQDVVLAYGQSDEYSFVFGEGTQIWERRSAKLATSVASLFTAEYVMQWNDPKFFGGNAEEGKEKVELTRPFPSFDGRCVCYPKKKILRDYLAWRQADCHINNLYNTTFWSMVLKGEGMSGTAAEEELKGTLAKNKNEILWSRFGINYNNEDAVWRKGTVVYRAYDDETEGDGEGKALKVAARPQSKSQQEKERKRKMKARIVVEHTDIIGDEFWNKRPYILGTGE